MPHVKGRGTVDLTAVTAFPATPQLSLTILNVPDEWFFVNESTDAEMHLSADGTNVDFVIKVNEPTEALVLESRQRKWFVKRAAGAVTGTPTLRWTATSKR